LYCLLILLASITVGDSCCLRATVAAAVACVQGGRHWVLHPSQCSALGVLQYTSVVSFRLPAGVAGIGILEQDIGPHQWVKPTAAWCGTMHNKQCNWLSQQVAGCSTCCCCVCLHLLGCFALHDSVTYTLPFLTGSGGRRAAVIIIMLPIKP
jgi:hypothetical protein